MTQLESRTTRCALCRHESHQQFLLSTSSIGSPDLDNRPAGLARNATINAIQQCPECGYCAREIDMAAEIAASVVGGDLYQSEVTVPTLFVSNTKWHRQSLVLATMWHGLSLIEEADNVSARAGSSALCSAWVYDDAKLVSLARVSRLRALGLFRKAQDQNERFSDGIQLEVAIMADLLRRADEFSAVLALYDQAHSVVTSEPSKAMLAFQRELAVRRDSRCHTVSEAFNKNTVRRRRAS